MKQQTQLLIIDPQNDFCDLPPALCPPGEAPALPVAGAHADLQRLAAFIAAPQKHRAHAARSLVVYHMLEHRRRPRQADDAVAQERPVGLGGQAKQREALALEALTRPPREARLGLGPLLLELGVQGGAEARRVVLEQRALGRAARAARERRRC